MKLILVAILLASIGILSYNIYCKNKYNAFKREFQIKSIDYKIVDDRDKFLNIENDTIPVFSESEDTQLMKILAENTYDRSMSGCLRILMYTMPDWNYFNLNENKISVLRATTKMIYDEVSIDKCIYMLNKNEFYIRANKSIIYFHKFKDGKFYIQTRKTKIAQQGDAPEPAAPAR